MAMDWNKAELALPLPPFPQYQKYLKSIMEGNGNGGRRRSQKGKAGGNPGSLAHAWQEVRNKEDEMGCLTESESVVYLRAGYDSRHQCCEAGSAVGQGNQQVKEVIMGFWQCWRSSMGKWEYVGATGYLLVLMLLRSIHRKGSKGEIWMQKPRTEFFFLSLPAMPGAHPKGLFL